MIPSIQVTVLVLTSTIRTISQVLVEWHLGQEDWMTTLVSLLWRIFRKFLSIKVFSCPMFNPCMCPLAIFSLLFILCRASQSNIAPGKPLHTHTHPFPGNTNLNTYLLKKGPPSARGINNLFINLIDLH